MFEASTCPTPGRAAAVHFAAQGRAQHQQIVAAFRHMRNNGFQYGASAHGRLNLNVERGQRARAVGQELLRPRARFRVAGGGRQDGQQRASAPR